VSMGRVWASGVRAGVTECRAAGVAEAPCRRAVVRQGPAAEPYTDAVPVAPSAARPSTGAMR